MPNVLGLVRAKATVVPPTTPTIYTVDVTIANTEFSQVLTSGTKRFLIRVKASNSSLRVAYATGTSITDNVVTVPRGTNYSEDDIEFSGTLFFQATNICKVEIVQWI